jgi:hypothetical protein
MGSTGVLQVTGIKETAALKLKALKAAGFINTAETVRCLHCSARYLLLIGLSSSEKPYVNILDLGKAIRDLTEKVSAEHATGHSSERIIVDREFAAAATGRETGPAY